MAVEETRWGILYCPKGRSSKQREKIQAVLDERHVQYDFVQSETSDSVERLMLMLIHNGYKTIIVMGGDSALNDAVNCLMQVEKQVRDTIALGVIPNGVMNDFARYWDFKEGNMEQTVDWLIKRRVRPVDLGCIRYTNKKGEKCNRYFLNCVNVGLIADVMNMRRQTRSMLGSRTLSFIVSVFLMIFHRMDYKMNVKINSDVINRKVMTMCVGSGPGYGQTPNAVPYNGLLDVSVVYHTGLLQVFAGLWLLLTGRFLNHRSVHPYRTREVRIEEAKHALVSIDGRLMGTPVGAYYIDVEQEVIQFLIPD
ncbi:MAG: lipid kinase [Prevotella sp.]|jgi:diacylglycerol kinase family enzyme|uniref:diacylglycerol/lipid kinase family protein n=1 Tax=Prevotella sp. tf2-5 TaxID=1761889 RepID=UPI0008F0AAF8|nr:diacylglycerol kinase family protein [Prevotella sp. tf2-5]MBR2243656.1 lipid kinase [Prevotella sp.]MCR5711591.1 lipid kinase [Prevotella sp.]SFO50741.1 Diacylglycerol kinase family enzyme [Prevotella sp. tf2-5]